MLLGPGYSIQRLIVGSYPVRRTIFANPLNYFAQQTLFISAATSTSKVSESTPGRKRKSTARSLLLDYVDANLTAAQANVLPKRKVRTTSQQEASGHLINVQVAEHIGKIIRDQNLDLESTVVEINPGLGFVTKELKDIGFKHLNGFEESTEFIPLLNQQHPELNVIGKRFLRLAELVYWDRKSGTQKAHELLKTLERQEENEGLVVVGVTPSVSVVSFILRCIIESSGLHDKEFGWKPVYYLVVHPSAYAILTATPAVGYFVYRVTSVLFQVFAKYELLAEFPIEASIPWKKPRSREASRLAREAGADVDENVGYLLKITPNTEFIQSIAREDIRNLAFFIESSLRPRSNGVISKIESWTPDCGPRLIKQGYTIFTKFGDLAPEEIVDLFMQFSVWPEFNRSAFKDARDTRQARESIEDDEVMDEVSNT